MDEDEKLQLDLLARWVEKAKAFRDAHYHASVRLRKLHYMLGIPTIILSAVVGTTVFATLEQTVTLAWRIVVAMTSVTAAVLAACQTFFRFSERAESHRQAFAGFDATVRDTQFELALPKKDRNLTRALTSLRKRMDDLSQAPELTHSDREAGRSNAWPTPAPTPRGQGNAEPIPPEPRARAMPMPDGAILPEPDVRHLEPPERSRADLERAGFRAMRSDPESVWPLDKKVMRIDPNPGMGPRHEKPVIPRSLVHKVPPPITSPPTLEEELEGPTRGHQK